MLPPIPTSPAVEFTDRICNNQWKPKSGFGHACITLDMVKEPILRMGTDKMIPRYVYDISFIIRFPDRSEWKHRLGTDRNGGIIRYTDASKINKGTGAGVYG
jgi:hypothetical protein